jgi:hypothetical protein
MSFTPGPWSIEKSKHEQFIKSEGTRVIANVDNSDGVDRANAKLIAAAPELLQAAKDLVNYASCLLTTSQFVKLDKQVTAMMQAIVKAEGTTS